MGDRAIHVRSVIIVLLIRGYTLAAAAWATVRPTCEVPLPNHSGAVPSCRQALGQAVKGSLEEHATRLRERADVTVSLRKWTESVMEEATRCASGLASTGALGLCIVCMCTVYNTIRIGKPCGAHLRRVEGRDERRVPWCVAAV